MRNSPSRRVLTLGFVACLLTGVSGSAQEVSQADGLNPFDPSVPANTITPSLTISQNNCGGSMTSKPPSEDPPPGLKSGGGSKPPATGTKSGTSSSSCGGMKSDGGSDTGGKTADDMRTRARDRAGSGLGYDNTGEQEPTTTGPQGPAIATGSELAAMLCKDGTKRPKDEPVDVSWKRMAKPANPVITYSSDADHGRYGEEGISEAAAAAEKALKAAGQIVGKIGGPAGQAAKGAVKVAELGARTAKAAADFANKAAKEHANTIMDLHMEIPMMTAALQCQKMELCVKGEWVEAGVEPVPDSLSTPDANPGTYNAPGILGKNMPREVRKGMNKYRPEYNRLEAFIKEPCAGDQGGGGTATGGGGGPSIATGGKGGGRNCQPILAEIRTAEGKLKDVTNAHAEAQIKVLDLKIEESKAELARIEEKGKVEKKIPAAETELKNAQNYLQSLKDNEKNVSPGNKVSYVQSVHKAESRVKAAETALKNLQGQLKAIDAKYDAKIKTINTKIGEAQKEVDRLAKEKASLNAQIDALWKKYNDCITGK